MKQKRLWICAAILTFYGTVMMSCFSGGKKSTAVSTTSVPVRTLRSPSMDDVTEIEMAINGGTVTDDTMVCPWCKNGNLKSIADGVNCNGTQWRVYRCTNNTAGCQYSWIVSFTAEESITRQFKEVKRKSMLRVSTDDLDRLKIENPTANFIITPGFGRHPQ